MVPQELPPTTSAFLLPFLAELVAGIASNAILLVLLVKTRKVPNNTNIFLASMACANVLAFVPTTLMMVATIKRGLLLNEGACLTAQLIVTIIQFPNILSHVFISHDRYNAVLRFCEWTPFERRTYFHVFFVWLLALVGGGAGAFFYSTNRNETMVPAVFCQLPYLHGAYNQQSLYSDAWITILVLSGLTQLAAAVFSILNYYYVLRKFLMVKDLYKLVTSAVVQRNRPPTFDNIDAEIQWKSEVKTTKAMCFVFIVNLAGFLSYYVCYTSILIKSFVAEQWSFDEVYDPVILVAAVMLYVLPGSVNPVALLITSSEFRKKILELLKLKARPDTTHESQESLSASDVRRPNNRVAPMSDGDKNSKVPTMVAWVEANRPGEP